MSEKSTKKQFPFVSVEQAAAYDPSKPETRTESRIVNAVVESLGQVDLAQQLKMAKHLDISSRALTGAIECDTGLTYPQFIEHWRLLTIARWREEGQKVAGDEMARRLGLSDHSSLWQYLKRKGLMDLRRLEKRREEDRLAWERIRAKEKSN